MQIISSQFLKLMSPLQVTTRYISQLKDGHPNHPFTKDFLAKVGCSFGWQS